MTAAATILWTHIPVGAGPSCSLGGALGVASASSW